MFDTITAPQPSMTFSFFVKLYRLLWIGADLYALSLLAYFVARWTVGDRFWVVLFLNNFIQWLLLPMLVLLPIALWHRYWWRVGLLSPLAVAFLLLFGTLFLPNRSQAAPADAQTLKVISFNVGSDHTYRGALVEYIRESHADIVGIVELGHWQAGDIAANLQDEYPYQLLNGRWVRGKGLLSRYPILESEWVNTNSHGPYIRAVLDVNGEPLTVWVIHLARPVVRRSWENPFEEDPAAELDLQAVIERLDNQQPTIVLGDFNATDQNRFHGWLEDAGFTDSYREVGQGFGGTFPAIKLPFPVIRIDYVWTNAPVQPLTAEVGDDGIGSDHFPLVVELALKIDKSAKE